MGIANEIESILSEDKMTEFAGLILKILKNENLINPESVLNRASLNEISKAFIKADFIKTSTWLNKTINDWKKSVDEGSREYKIQCDYIKNLIGWLLISNVNEYNCISNCCNEKGTNSEEAFAGLKDKSRTSSRAEVLCGKYNENPAKFRVINNDKLEGQKQINWNDNLENGPLEINEYTPIVICKIYKDFYFPEKMPKNISSDKLEEINEAILMEIESGENIFLAIHQSETSYPRPDEIQKEVLKKLPALSSFVIDDNYKNDVFYINDSKILGRLHTLLKKMD